MKYMGLLSLPLLASAMDLTPNSNGYAPVSLDGVYWYNGDYTWSAMNQNHTWSPWAENYLAGMDGKDVAWAKAMIDLAAMHGTQGLRTFTAAFDKASFNEQAMCHQATGDRFHLESQQTNPASGQLFPQLQWQVKELALMVRFGLAKPETFKVWADQLGNCAGFIPGQDNFNFKQIITRDLAIFEAAATSPAPAAAGSAIGGAFEMKQTVDFKGNAAAKANDWESNEAFAHAAVVYDRLFTGAYFVDHAAGAETNLQSSYGSYNCPNGGAATAILSVADFKEAEKFMFQLAMAGAKGDCGDSTSFAKIAAGESADQVDANGNALFTSSEAALRQFAYQRALNAIEMRSASTAAVSGTDNMNMYLAGVGVVVLVISVFQFGQQQMLDKRQ